MKNFIKIIIGIFRFIKRYPLESLGCSSFFICLHFTDKFPKYKIILWILTGIFALIALISFCCITSKESERRYKENEGKPLKVDRPNMISRTLGKDK